MPWNPNIPAVSNQISADVPDIEENFDWLRQLVRMCIGWKDNTIANVSPPGPQRSRFSYSDADTIIILPGVYFHDGTTRQTVFWDAAITFNLGPGGSNGLSDALGADEWHYIYLDDSAIITQASPELDAGCFLNDTTAPTWSDAKHGWYNGSDRCIFAVLTDGSNNILEFFHDGGDLVYYAGFVHDRDSEDLDVAWTDVTLTIPAFCRRAQVLLESYYVDGTVTLMWRTNGQTDGVGHHVGISAVGSELSSNTFPVITDSNLKIEIRHSAAGGNTAVVYTDGWYFPVGI